MCIRDRTDFGPKREQWLGFIYLVDAWEGEIFETNAEGSLEWVPIQRLLDACSPDASVRKVANLPIWEGDRYFLPLVFDSDPRCFHGSMPYDGIEFVDWVYERH